MGVPSEKFDAAIGHILDEVEYASQQLEWTFQEAEDEDRAAHALLGIRALAEHLREMRP